MRTFVYALMGFVTFCLLAFGAQAATWQDRVLGQWSSKPQYRAPITRQTGEAAPRKRSTRATKGVRRGNRTASRSSARRSRATASSGRTLSGLASYYWQPQRVASGGWFNPNALTAAHKSLPFGTRVRVTNLRNGRSVVVRINDRGPYIRGRIIDLSRRAATIVGMRNAGVVPVRVQVL
jgi:rare lipoprotein A